MLQGTLLLLLGLVLLGSILTFRRLGLSGLSLVIHKMNDPHHCSLRPTFILTAPMLSNTGEAVGSPTTRGGSPIFALAIASRHVHNLSVRTLVEYIKFKL